MNTIFQGQEEMLEEGKSLVKKTTDQAVKQVKTTVQTAASQVTGVSNAQTPNGGQGVDFGTVSSDQSSKDFVKDLYKPSAQQSTQVSQQIVTNSQQPGSDDQKSLEETRKKIKLLNEQHTNVYYKPTFDPDRKKEEEKPAEKVEREEQEKLQQLQLDDKEKLPPLAVTRAQTSAENKVGFSG